MKECLLSGLLSVAGKKVLHLDRNPYYGGASASLTIDQLFQKFGVAQPPTEAELGKLRDYNIDLVPKFIMAGYLAWVAQTQHWTHASCARSLHRDRCCLHACSE